MKYQAWSVATSDPAGRAALEQAGVSPLLAAVLSARGVDTAEQARQLLFPPPRQLSDPLLIRDMDKAVQRVRLAMERGEKVAVYGDYDVDGITATCLLTDLLVRRGVPVTPYIPSRLDEGYGLNREAVSLLAGQGVSLIITVDCGITAVEETELARSLGVDVVITDTMSARTTCPRPAPWWTPAASTAPAPSRSWRGWAWP